MATITVEQLDEIVRVLFEKRAEVEQLEAQVSELNKGMMGLQEQAVAALKELGRKNYQTPAGTISISERWWVTTPKTEEQKKALFDFLKERGVLWEYATVNSNSLNSLFLAEWDAAKEKGEGMGFVMPGVGDPSMKETVSLRRSKS